MGDVGPDIVVVEKAQSKLLGLSGYPKGHSRRAGGGQLRHHDCKAKSAPEPDHSFRLSYLPSLLPPPWSALHPSLLHPLHSTFSSQSHTVDIPDEIKASLRKFRFARRNAGSAAIVVKINKQKLIMEEVEQFDNISLEDLAEGCGCCSVSCFIISHAILYSELPENSPRYVVLSYELNHSDGRKSFPLVLVNWSPTSSETGMLTLHASALLEFQNVVRIFSPFSSSSSRSSLIDGQNIY